MDEALCQMKWEYGLFLISMNSLREFLSDDEINTRLQSLAQDILMREVLLASHVQPWPMRL